jgi:cellobiose-specific phosphotransferase system component IIC
MSRSSAASKPSSAASKLQALSKAPFLVAVHDALPWAFGALVLALAAFLAAFSAPFPTRISLALLPSFGVMACALAIALPLAYARLAHSSPIVILASTLSCFAIALPRPFGPDGVSYLRSIGATGIFLAILMTGFVAFAIWVMRRSFDKASVFIAGGVAVVVVAFVVYGAHVDISRGIAAALEPLARMGDSYPALLAIVGAEMLLWLVGVHGPAMLAAVVTPVYLTLQMQNTAAFASHVPLPHVVVVSLFLFIFPGGSGATLPLAVLLAISRVARLRRLGRLVLLPALANVNEPLLFGLPIVLNPFFAIPFVGVPLLLASVTYLAVVGGIVARPAFYVPSSVPAPISTYLATLDPRAPALLCVNLLIALALYLPFVRAYERHLEASAA